MYQPPLERLLRNVLRNSTPKTLLLLTFDTLGAFTALTYLWEHAYTIQLSAGPSMYPTFSVRGDYMLISRWYRHGRGVEVGDVVRFWHPSFGGVHGAKRVLGLEGDFVCRDRGLSKGVGGEGPDAIEEGGRREGEREMIQVCLFFLYSDGVVLIAKVPPGHIYLGGDNLPWSRDSRSFGPVPLGLVNGKVIARVWPFDKAEWVKNTLVPAQLDKDVRST